MSLQNGQLKAYDTRYGKEEALYFSIDENELWIKRHLKNNRYEVKGLLAIGGFGCVFGAIDHWNYDKQVVIKTPFYMGDYCRPYIARSQNAFEQQIKSLNTFYAWEKKHLSGFSNAGFDSIVNLNDYFTDRNLDLCKPFMNAAGVEYFVSENLRENAPYLVMKYMPGKMLKDILKDKKLSQVQTLRMAKQILVLMRYLHKERSTKRGRQFYYLLCDLKAENMIICDREICLIDFGAIKIHWVDQAEIDIPIFVTDGYAAPEVYSGSLEFRDNTRIDKRFDIFTIGALMVHCLTGKHPIEFLEHASPPQYNFNLDEYDKISDPVKEIIAKATAKNRDDRFPSAEVMVKQIRKALDNL